MQQIGEQRELFFFSNYNKGKAPNDTTEWSIQLLRAKKINMAGKLRNNIGWYRGM